MMRETEELDQLVDGKVKEDKAAYQRPTLRRIGWLRDVTAQASTDEAEV
ncbi:MAG TPA: hypothetical protein VN494_10030 [Patescibacteria group bacterium]|nr:hypothetical protein [Patescibacteria group bacterium]